MTDDELMAQGASGDEDAFRALVARWEQPLFAFLHRMLGSTEEAQDVGQETFLRMFQQAGRYQPSGQFKSWIFRIAGNLARSRLRRRKIVRWIRFEPLAHDRAQPTPGVDVQLERDDVRDAVRNALARLPERQRQAILLRRYENMRYEDVAGVMGTTVPAVESLLSRAMATLRKDLAGSEVIE
jgi:RNA polymerase sigma-70 factor (ECF subfamily)